MTPLEALEVMTIGPILLRDHYSRRKLEKNPQFDFSLQDVDLAEWLPIFAVLL